MIGIIVSGRAVDAGTGPPPLGKIELAPDPFDAVGEEFGPDEDDDQGDQEDQDGQRGLLVDRVKASGAVRLTRGCAGTLGSAGAHQTCRVERDRPAPIRSGGMRNAVRDILLTLSKGCGARVVTPLEAVAVLIAGIAAER